MVWRRLIGWFVCSASLASSVSMVQGVAEAAAHPETVASLALVTPAASASSPLHQLAVSRRLVAPPLIIHSEAGQLSAQATFVLAADPGATAVVLRG